MKFTILTLGCRTNIAESEKLRAVLKNKNFEYTDNIGEADYVFINTCTVTHRADRDSRKLVNRVLKKNKKAKIYVFGCAFYLFLNKKNLNILPSFEELIKNLKFERIEEKVLSPSESGHSRYFLKIQEGCDYKCSFCIVPFKRGKSRSYPLEKIIKEAEIAIQKGYKEIVLTGTQIGDYGKDTGKYLNLGSLIEKLLEISPSFRIRLSSLHPAHLYKIFYLLSEQRIVPHLHIPLQSASQKVLRDMKRPYTIEFYEKTLNKILKIRRKFNIGTDLIVGFPTEGKKEFNETLKFIENSPFSYIHIFSFSKRKGTAAAKLKEINPEEIKERIKIIKEIDIKKRNKFMQSLLNEILEPVYEKKENGFMKGLSEYGIKVKFKGNNIRKGDIVKIKAENIEKECIVGSIIKP